MPEIIIPSLDGTSFAAHLAIPEGNHGPGLILVRGLFDTPEQVAALSARYAEQGFVVVSPNLFHRQSGGAAVGAGDALDWEKAAKLYKTFDVEAGARDLIATMAYVRGLPACSGNKIGVVGYCLGCRLAFLLAARSDIDCAVGYYGVGIESLLDEVHDIRAPVLLHFGENDKLLPPSAKQKIERALGKNKAIACHTYPAAEHGFAREGGASFHPVHAATAMTRSIDFLSMHLKR